MENYQGLFDKHVYTGGINSRSPVGPYHKLKPLAMRARDADNFLERIKKRVMPLVTVRAILNKIYSEGYFENHYRKADAVWDEALIDHVGTGSFGEFLQKKVLTLSKWLGLK